MRESTLHRPPRGSLFSRSHMELDAIEARIESKACFPPTSRLEEVQREVRRVAVRPGSEDAKEKELTLERIEEMSRFCLQGRKNAFAAGLERIRLDVARWETAAAAGEAVPRNEVLGYLHDLEGVQTDYRSQEHEMRKELCERLRKLDRLQEAPRTTMEPSGNLAWRLSHTTERLERWRTEYEKSGALPPVKELEQMKRTLSETDTAGDTAVAEGFARLTRQIDWMLDRIKFKAASPHLFRGICRSTQGLSAFR